MRMHHLLALALVGSLCAADLVDNTNTAGYKKNDSTTNDPATSNAPEPEPPMLGIQMSPVPARVQAKEGITSSQGVFVREVFDNSAADRMGIQKGDVILSVNNNKIGSMTDLRAVVGTSQVGDPVQVLVTRNGQTVQLDDRLGAWPKEIPVDAIDPAAEQRYRNMTRERALAQAQNLDQMQKQVDALKQQIASNPAYQAPNKNAKQPIDSDPLNISRAEAENMLPDELALLPSWRLHVVLARGPAQPREAVDVAPQTPMGFSKPAQVVPAEVSLRFVTDSNVF